MADETLNLTLVAGTWTEAAAGDGSFLATGSDNWAYAYATAQPAAGFLGHFVYATQNEILAPSAGQSAWVRSERAMKLALTPAEG